MGEAAERRVLDAVPDGLLIGGAWGPAALLAGAVVAAAAALALAWLRYGRDILSPTALLSAPFYAVRKIPLYLGFFTRPQSEWVRTQRDAVRPEL